MRFTIHALVTMVLQPQHMRSREKASRIDMFRPICKAYALGYLTSTIPRLPSVIRTILLSRLTIEQKWKVLRTVLSGAIGLNRFPTSCAIIVGGGTILSTIVTKILLWLHHVLPFNHVKRILCLLERNSNFICYFLSAWVSFDLLNRDATWARKRANSMATREQMRPALGSPNQHHLLRLKSSVRYAGKTVDFTLFAACRAADVLMLNIWHRFKRAQPSQKSIAPNLSYHLQQFLDPFVFSMSSAVIMWSWFYSPERLPKTYNQWIAKIAQIDTRLINALRLCRQGELTYGRKDTQDASLPSLCKELGLPESWGDPSTTIPIPCELYHCGAGRSCEVHATARYLKTFMLAMQLYLPLQSLSILRRPSISITWFQRSLRDATRSSSFLAAFVTLFYYGVCIARTRVGPKLFSRATVTPQMWDSGLCVLVGCLACGWSILFEKPGRRQEIAFFVAPRALATLLPRVYNGEHQRREQIAFSASIAIVMNAMHRNENNVRGVFGRVLKTVLC